ncbi:CAP domain-containing protein [Candidatus Uhrbacteria bacterium]|nr:CAP domain-containing protein [Candidatus Uhrbacteria bacterium]
MRDKGLGITNDNLFQIPIATTNNPLTSNNPDVKNPQIDGQNRLNSEYLEQRTHELINAHRQSTGVKTLVWRDIIAEQARVHSQNIANGDIEPSHVGFEQRVDNIAVSIYPYYGAAENLAWNNLEDPAQGALDWWLQSPDHLTNLENADYDYTGIGVAKKPNGTVYYFTQIFFDVDQ